MKNIVIGVLAHVDAGKTTLSEAILYSAGAIRTMGRVDNRDTLLDSNALERERKITIFSKQACFDTGKTHVSWLDTPGHIDFFAETERTLQVLDYAVLVVSAVCGIESHTKTLWKLLKQYNIPCFIFVNKTDRPETDRDLLLSELREGLSDTVIDFTDKTEKMYEDIAVMSEDEGILNLYLKNGLLNNESISELIGKRRIFPCIFGSALKTWGVERLLEIIDCYTVMPKPRDGFAARVYKITRDVSGVRLTHIKITGGSLKVRDLLDTGEKVTQIRIYSGDKYECPDSADQGMICAIRGLEKTTAGQGLGLDFGLDIPLTEPVISYRLICPDGVSKRQIYSGIKKLEEEAPELNADWNEETSEISIRLMGQVQLEVLSELIKERLNIIPDFDKGRITYKETIASPVTGIGHFEPLRHYAEVCLRLEPAERGSGVTAASELGTDVLDRNWQRLIISHIKEYAHRGVLTGACLTDVKITLINGAAHQKHTEGGDFRQAVYRAVRQGLMHADNVLLEPYYNFTLEIPDTVIGRVMTDMDAIGAKISVPEIFNGVAVISGYGPVSTIRDYQADLRAKTSGLGNMTVSFAGYDVCHNTEEVIENSQYEPDCDLKNPSSSVFCSNGAGFIVPWYEVPEYMHLKDDTVSINTEEINNYRIQNGKFDYTIDNEEIDEIFSRTFEANSRQDKNPFKKKSAAYYDYRDFKAKKDDRSKLLIVDGYNVIFAWDALKTLADSNMDSAKDSLIRTLSDYYGITEVDMLLVFDGYRVKGGTGSSNITDGINVIYTKENETADLYIEQFTLANADKYKISVVTSDGMIQRIARGADAQIISSREFYDMIADAKNKLREEYNL